MSGLVETVDKVMEHMASRLQSSADSVAPLSIGGRSSVAGLYILYTPTFSQYLFLEIHDISSSTMHGWREVCGVCLGGRKCI